MQCANLDIFQGDDFAQPVEVFTDDDPPQPADLTGYTALAQIRSDVADLAPEVVAELIINIELPNIIHLSLPHTVTETLTQDYLWDLQLSDAAGIRTTLMGGDVRVTLEVSRLAVAS
jgi:hypothetical protein